MSRPPLPPFASETALQNAPPEDGVGTPFEVCNPPSASNSGCNGHIRYQTLCEHKFNFPEPYVLSSRAEGFHLRALADGSAFGGPWSRLPIRSRMTIKRGSWN